ncbi:hypothetical protein, partial [Megamonas funiformis]|uniref:hypothetical protein n=1 Tax=Megamonas funiformis TaxID=437897 RepID=UPI00266F93B2
MQGLNALTLSIHNWQKLFHFFIIFLNFFVFSMYLCIQNTFIRLCTLGKKENYFKGRPLRCKKSTLFV